MKVNREVLYWPNRGKHWEFSLVNGEMHGLETIWYPNGNKCCVNIYKKNIEHGATIEFIYGKKNKNWTLAKWYNTIQDNFKKQIITRMYGFFKSKW